MLGYTRYIKYWVRPSYTALIYPLALFTQSVFLNIVLALLISCGLQNILNLAQILDNVLPIVDYVLCA
jgi:hypothetical protein